MTKPKSDQEIFHEAWIEMHSHEWLFPYNRGLKNEAGQEIDGPLSADEYLRHYAHKQSIFHYRCPMPYKFELLEKYKDKVVLSGHMQRDNGMTVPYSVFQLEHPGVHMVADWIWDNDSESFFFPTTLYLYSQADYHKFLTTHRDFERIKSKLSLGFK